MRQDGWILANFFIIIIIIFFFFAKKKERGQYPGILTEQAWSIKDLLCSFIFKLKLQQQNKTEHETVRSGKKFIIAGRYKIYFRYIFGLVCYHEKQGILNYLKALIL